MATKLRPLRAGSGLLWVMSSVLVLMLAVGYGAAGAFAVENGGANRFNVVMVADASGSMLDTDPDNLRFEAISQFAGLLAEKGNYLGSVVFSDKVASTQALAPADSPEAKNKVVESIKAVKPDGDTNIGEALETAVRMIDEKGSKDLPSVMLLLSDGNTDLPNGDEAKSLDQKATAISKAREKGVKIYSVCLNKNNGADVSEMEQISAATNGVFKEVKKVEDLQEVFKAFYELIYGTSTVQLVDEKFSDEGVLETVFDIPSIGVEEVNIIIYGEATSEELLRPDGSDASAAVMVTKGSTYTMMKLLDVAPGRWTLRTQGVPGDSIRVNMVFNTNLAVEVTAKPEGDLLNPVDPLTVTARLTENGKAATSKEQYEGYEANLVLMDANEQTLETVPMPFAEDRFEVEKTLAEGNYLYKVQVTGNSVAKSSQTFGPIVVSGDASSEEQKANKAPVAVVDPYEDSKTLYPWTSDGWELDLTGLAKDDQKEPLEYAVVSSSLREDDDYKVDGKTLKVSKLDKYSLSTASFFTVRATDKWGKSTDIDVNLKTRSATIWSLIGMGVAGLFALALLGFGAWRLSQKPVAGTIRCYSNVGGSVRGDSKLGGKGKVRLGAFGLDATGLDYRKSYFQATGDRFIYLITDKPVTVDGKEGLKKVELRDGRDYMVEVAPGRKLRVRFDSSMKRKPERTTKGKMPQKKASKGKGSQGKNKYF